MNIFMCAQKLAEASLVYCMEPKYSKNDKWKSTKNINRICSEKNGLESIDDKT